MSKWLIFALSPLRLVKGVPAVHHQIGDGTVKVLSILSRDRWGFELLAAVADRKILTKNDLLFLKRADLGRISTDVLERRLSLMQTAGLLEIDGDLVMITELGALAANNLYDRNHNLGQDQEISQSIVAPSAAAADGTWSSNSSIASENAAGASGQHAPTIRPTFSERSKRDQSTGLPNERHKGLHSADTLGPAREPRLSFLRRLMPRRRNAKNRQQAPIDSPKWSQRFVSTLVLVSVLIVVGLSYIVAQRSPSAASYRFAVVQRAEFAVTTIATGQVRAIDAVEVSSQLSGQVIELFASFNDEVEAGAPLAKIDDKIFQSNVAEAQARVAHAKASHDSAVAATAGATARYEQARQDFERKKSLATKGSISAQEVEKAQANLLTAESERNAARADEAVQQASIDMAEATLRKSEIDLERTIIRSPIDGVIIRRSVELGQTVAASLEAPTLFTIAQELSEMQVYARVDEADIGQIRLGQRSGFSVDAYPGRVFSGKVVEIHRAPESVQNVITYTVVITADNKELSLLPGMTALVSIVTTERPAALLVPNSALRFEPATSETIGRDRQSIESQRTRPHVWVRSDAEGLVRVEIDIGASDGSVTEVVSGALIPGQQVAIGQQISRDQKTLFGLRLGF